MKNSFFLISITLLIIACGFSTKSNEGSSQETKLLSTLNTLTDTKVNQKPKDLNTLFTLSDAEKILGEPAHLSDSSTTRDADGLKYLCGYKAKKKDPKSKKTGAVYFFVQEYNELSAAEARYGFIRTANANHKGIKVLDDIGDEAYFHSDGENFYFIMVRKGAKVFNMKVNKITSNTSLAEFNTIAKRITDSL